MIFAPPFFSPGTVLRSKVEELKLKEVDSELASSDSSNSTSKNLKYKNSIFSRFQKAKTRIVNDELLEYLRLDEIDWEENPFAWPYKKRMSRNCS
ncbi:uncharacterized protein OCT59_025395 [Rhizophagus irregularis]|uniref:uncharacterized protein n=1 Tax=Rhizophagus irregularis TaxID=588596 RepID=UPI000CBB39C3|nr:hypothetical protein OCT59_025395 [Rhizophagus irregularis]